MALIFQITDLKRHCHFHDATPMTALSQSQLIFLALLIMLYKPIGRAQLLFSRLNFLHVARYRSLNTSNAAGGSQFLRDNDHWHTLGTV